LSIAFCLLCGAGMFGIIRAIVPERQRKMAYIFGGFICAFFVCAMPIFVFMFPFVAYDALKVQTQDRHERESEKFWDWFASIDKDLYCATSPSDLVLSKLQSKLDELDPGLTFRLGPTSAGRRELALIDTAWDGYRARTGSSNLSQAAYRRNLKKWMVGIGFDYQKYNDGGLEYGSNGNRISAHNKDFQCTALRNGDVIDVTVYTDLPIGTQFHKDMPVDFFEAKNLGDELYRCYLGETTILPTSQIGSAKTQTIGHLRGMFLQLMTGAELREMAAKISTKPVIVYVDAPEKHLGIGGFQLQHHPNPAMKLRRPEYQ